MTADVLGEVARRTSRAALADGITHPEDIAHRIEFALEGAVLALTVLSEERK